MALSPRYSAEAEHDSEKGLQFLHWLTCRAIYPREWVRIHPELRFKENGNLRWLLSLAELNDGARPGLPVGGGLGKF